MSTSNNRLWSVDADDFGDIGDGLLYETTWIKSFLAPDGTSRFLLVATKGYGKTLLLRAKRLRLESQREGMHLMPENALTDRPFGSAKVFSQNDINWITDNENFWENIWLLSITIAITKFVKKIRPDNTDLIDQESLFPHLAKIFSDKNLLTITDHFPLILELGPKYYFKAMRDFNTIIAPVYRNLHLPISAFIDNVDEYFDIHLQPSKNTSSSSGIVDKSFWYSSQIGLASAIRNLHGHNHHIKIFASIRKEAFEKLLHEKQTALQFEGSSIRIEYDFEDLKQIFIRNLIEEPEENKIQISGRTIFEKFFGEKNCHIWHPHVGEPEYIWDYILRHTLLRPRDLMTIGARLSSIHPDRRDISAIRHTINDTSSTISSSYINEIKPHLTMAIDFDLLFSLIPRNVLSREDVEEIAYAYNRQVYDQDVTEESPAVIHVFCALYKCGLLGYVTQTAGAQGNIQKFERPGDKTFAADGVLPPSDVYIIHPALDESIRKLSAEYGRSFDTLNIAGANRPWRDESSRRGVLKADIVGYSKIMEDPALAIAFPKDLESIVSRNCQKLDFKNIVEGDSLLLIDRNLINLISAIVGIARDLRESEYKAYLRAGADFGVVVEGENGQSGQLHLVGMPLRTAARLEALTAANTLAMTGEFTAAMCNFKADFEYQSAVDLENFNQLPRDDGKFNIKKPKETDPDTWKQVFFIRLSE